LASSFKERLGSGSFQLIAKITPPKSADLSSAVDLASGWKGKVDSLLIADNPSAVMGISSLVLAERLKREGHDVILCLSCRDRNRMALGSTALGAAASGIDSMLCVSGDYFNFGDHPEAKPVYDLDSVQLISMLREMENGRDMAGNALEGDSPSFCLGAAVCPTADPLMPQLAKARKKIAAGANFFITLPVFTTSQLDQFLEGIKDSPVKLFAGVLLPTYQEITRYQDGSIPGTFIPQDLIDQWRSRGEEAFRASSADHVKDLISKLKDSSQVAGVCASAPGRESEIERLT
jgi:5,10-methylenetetrahydrofolate reductase